jgi:hypothetical protein
MTEPPKTTRSLPWPEDDSNELANAHYAAIGRVAAEWAALETTIDTRSLQLAEIKPEVGICFTAQISGWARKLDAYIAVANWWGAVKTVKKLNVFAKDTNGLAEQRNRIVHDPWVGFKQPHRLEATARKKLRFEFIHMPTDDVLKVSRLITEHVIRFDRLADEVEAELNALNDKPPPASP